MTAAVPSRKGPWTHRLLVQIFTVSLSVLVFWLLGFLMDDIGDWPGPDYTQLEQNMLEPQLVEKSRSLDAQTAETERRITDERARQAILRESTQTSQATMKQLLEIQSQGLKKDVTPTDEQQKALADSESHFLSNQKRYQALNEEIARLDETLRGLQQQRRKLEQTIEEKRDAIRAEFDRQQQAHNLRIALVKLAALSPLIAAAAWLFLRHRSSLYAPMIYAFGAAVLLKVALVMHEYFPSRYFKYVLILVCLAAVVPALTSLLRMVAHPKSDWLLKQYREAYETFFCPICDYPIRRGPLKYLSWTRRTIRRLTLSAATGSTEPEQPYTCPICATPLFEECGACHGVRHSLLPACCHCGTQKPTPGDSAVPPNHDKTRAASSDRNPAVASAT